MCMCYVNVDISHVSFTMFSIVILYVLLYLAHLLSSYLPYVHTPIPIPLPLPTPTPISDYVLVDDAVAYGGVVFVYC